MAAAADAGAVRFETAGEETLPELPDALLRGAEDYQYRWGAVDEPRHCLRLRAE